MAWTDEQLDNDLASSGGIKLRRFWMRVGEEARIVVLNDAPYIVSEHIVFGESGPVYATCMADGDPGACQACLDVEDPQRIAYMQILKYWKNQEGIWICTRALYPMKRQTFLAWKAIAQDRGGLLAGWKVKLRRTTPKSATVGDVYDFQSRIERKPGETWPQAIARECAPGLQWLSESASGGRITPEQYCTPLDLAKVLAPSKVAVQRFVAAARRATRAQGGRAGGSYSAETQDEVPF